MKLATVHFIDRLTDVAVGLCEFIRVHILMLYCIFHSRMSERRMGTRTMMLTRVGWL